MASVLTIDVSFIKPSEPIWFNAEALAKPIKNAANATIKLVPNLFTEFPFANY
ncbi:hypothetical protein [Polynucleobacter sp. AP-Reno-20A-A9]|uniref:hypothetical protein n=1 Tax=Polynucleobacter sp. AP-Reno-20A-A9 TaxID=2576925 RepID=UPI001C0C5889|nr:hypothetical protein [Polynucleobacter sp. AP-Reno-20A-A9]